jgi:hypothetical protein
MCIEIGWRQGNEREEREKEKLFFFFFNCANDRVTSIQPPQRHLIPPAPLSTYHKKYCIYNEKVCNGI